MKQPQLVALGVGAIAIVVAFFFLSPRGNETPSTTTEKSGFTTGPSLEESNSETVATKTAQSAKAVQKADSAEEREETVELAELESSTATLSPVVIEMINNPEYYGATDILDAIGYDSGPERADKIIAAYRASKSMPIGVQESLLNELSYEEAGNENIHALLIEELQSSDPEARQRASDNIKFYDDESIKPALEELMKNTEDPKVIAATAELLDWLNAMPFSEYKAMVLANTPAHKRAEEEARLDGMLNDAARDQLAPSQPQPEQQ